MSMRTLNGHLESRNGRDWTDGESWWSVMPKIANEGRVIVFSIWSEGDGAAYYHYPFNPENPASEYVEECEFLEGHECWTVDLRDVWPGEHE